MKVLFLDLDGVCNSQTYFIATVGERTFENLASQLDPVAVALLNGVVDRTGCEVVISSTWRLIHTLGEIYRALHTKGYKHRLYGVTPNSSSGYRGKEILAWLSDNPECETYAVVDDSSDMTGVRDRFVQTTWMNGLQQEHVEKLVELLGLRGRYRRLRATRRIRLDGRGLNK